MGGKAPDPPDYTPVANASVEAAQLGYLGAQDQLNYARERDARLQPLFEGLTASQIRAADGQIAIGNRQLELTEEQLAWQRGIGDRQLGLHESQLEWQQGIGDRQIAMAEDQAEMARDVYDYQASTFRPVEQQIVKDAQEFNTDAYREQLARQAAGGLQAAFAQQEDARERQMASMGANPNSGRYQDQARQTDIARAAMTAQTMNATRDQARERGRSLMAGAAGLGRGMGEAIGAYSGANHALEGASGSMSRVGEGLNSAANAYGAAGAGYGAAGNTALAPGNAFLGAANNAYGTGLQGANIGVQGLSNVARLQTGVWGKQADNAWSREGALIGGGFGLLGSAIGMSDIRLKADIQLVGRYPNGFKQYEFRYKDDPSKQRYRGVIAQEVERERPEAVVDVGGYKGVRYNLLGISMEQVV